MEYVEEIKTGRRGRPERVPKATSMQKTAETTYEKWMKKEGIPIVQGHGVWDLREVERGPWPRTGGLGAFVQLHGLEGFTGVYIGEIPGQGALNPERHLYEEVIYILEGLGVTEVAASPKGERNIRFEWGPGSMFAIPLNARHRLVNGGRDPVVFLAVTSAPVMMDLLHNEDFIFNNDYWFADRFNGSDDYFQTSNKRYRSASGSEVWETNFIAEVLTALTDHERHHKAVGGGTTLFQIAENALVGHIAEWPAGHYHQAHWHGGGAVLSPISSEGYVLLWPREAGTRPYQEGNGDQVVKVEWKEGGLYSPPTGWFHQHFNTGREKAKHVAFRYSENNHKYAFGIFRASVLGGVNVSIREGGNLIKYEDEDPRIRQDFEEELKKKGIECPMPPVTYRYD